MNPADRDYPYATRGQLCALPWIPRKKRMRTAKLQVFGKAKKWYVRLRYSNGRKALVSESYTRKADAVRAKGDVLAAIKGIK